MTRAGLIALVLCASSPAFSGCLNYSVLLKKLTADGYTRKMTTFTELGGVVEIWGQATGKWVMLGTSHTGCTEVLLRGVGYDYGKGA